MKTIHARPAVVLALTLAILMAPVLGGGTAAAAEQFDATHAGYDRLLKAVVAGGRVDYARLLADPGALDEYLQSAAGVTEARFDAWPENQRLAFLLNLYNAATLRLILDHYPLESIKQIGGLFKGPWDQPVVGLFGRRITLDTLEHDILRKRYREPRIHMALVCAAKGCPALRQEAYVAERLNAQLDDQARRYLNSAAGLRIARGQGVVYFSAIFKWFGDDFRALYDPPRGFDGLTPVQRAVANFCASYLPQPEREYLAQGGYDVRYLPYDWSLNAK